MEEKDIEPIGRGLSVRCYLATIGKSGEPHVVPVHPGWEGSTIWIMTERSAVKSRNISHNPRVAMHWETDELGDGLLVWGDATIHGDLATKTRLWTGAFDYDLAAFAPEGINSPETAFLEIEPMKYTHSKRRNHARCCDQGRVRRRQRQLLRRLGASRQQAQRRRPGR